MTQGTATALGAVVTELSERYYERAEVVRALMVAILAGQHSLVLGPPGTAKSDLARELTSRFDGAQYWEVLLSKFTAPQRLFGPIDVAALTRGEYRQVFDGRATEAHIAFVDEIFKCSTAALNEMLAFLNERLYHPENGGAPISCPLISAVTASNELPTGEESAAIYDRLLVRLEVGYLADPSNFAALVRSAVSTAAATGPRTTVGLADLQSAVRIDVPAVSVPDAVVDVVCQLRTTLRREELVASDRRWKQCIRLLQASAYLDGRAEVDDTDLSVLTHALWDSVTQRPTVERAVLSLVNPDARAALDVLDMIEEQAAELESKAGQSSESLSKWGIDANTKLARAGKKLAEMHAQAVAAGRSTATLDRVMARRKAVHGSVMVEALGVDASMVSGTL
ncbi:AAA family ATPase [Nocardia takedensis]|uniref:AAA family ATPase n=1 Tax=Nocardia takedensis TaxID=259390 RepID=UPI003F766618